MELEKPGSASGGVAGKMGKIPSLAVVMYCSSTGALFYLVKQDSLSLDLPTEVLLYLVKAWLGRVPS